MENERIDIAVEGTSENMLNEAVSITVLLEFLASRLGVLLWGWATVMLVQGVIVSALETKDCVFVTVMLLFVCFRYWAYICPQATGLSSLNAASRVSSNPLEVIGQELGVTVSFISCLFYGCKLVCAMTSVVLSTMQLFSQDFGPTEVANKMIRDFDLNVFYSVALVEGLLLLCKATLEVYKFIVLRCNMMTSTLVYAHREHDFFEPKYVLQKLVKTCWISTFDFIFAVLSVQYAFAFLLSQHGFAVKEGEKAMPSADSVHQSWTQFILQL